MSTPTLDEQERAVVRALVGMVMQDIPGCDDKDPADYGIEKPHRQFISFHLGFHAAALRALADYGAMDIEDRGGRLVLGSFKPDWLIDNGFVAYAWRCACDDEERESLVQLVEVDRDGKPKERRSSSEGDDDATQNSD